MKLKLNLFSNLKLKMESFLCKYKDSLGVPYKGIHKQRLFGVAMNDLLMTLIGSLIFSYIFKTKPLYTISIIFLTGVILHLLFCVDTSFTLFLKKIFHKVY
jgi:hypothetical protein